MTAPDSYVIQYRVADGPWKHGRSIEPWVFEDKAVLREQRRYTVDFAREAEGGVAERITTRVLGADEAQRRLDEEAAEVVRRQRGESRTITEQDHQDIGVLVQWADEALKRLDRHGVKYPLMPEVVTRLGRSLGPWSA